MADYPAEKRPPLGGMFPPARWGAWNRRHLGHPTSSRYKTFARAAGRRQGSQWSKALAVHVKCAYMYAIFTPYASANFLAKIANFFEISRNLRVFETKLKRNYTATSAGVSKEILI